MDARTLWFFHFEVEAQCRFVLRARDDLERAVVDEDSDAVWYALQALLIAAANISRLVWGSRRSEAEAERIEDERRGLRESLRLNKRSPLYSRKVRNAFEHIDEELASHTGPYVNRNIGPSEMWRVRGAKRFGHYDPETQLVTFYRESVNIGRIVAEVERIFPIVHAKTRQPRRRGS